MLLSKLIESQAVYVPLHGKQLTAADTLRQIETAMKVQDVSRPLKEIPLLVLNECDRIQADEISEWLPSLLFELTGGRVVLLGRRLPPVVAENARLRALTRFIPADDGLMLWDYAQHENKETALLEVHALGSGRVMLNGKPVDSWDGVLPRSLFFYLVDRGMTTRADIFATFWPTLTVRDATNVFHVTKRKISEVLGMDLTAYWSGFYRIASNIHLSYDAANFSEMVQNGAVVDDEEASRLFSRALRLYRGHFLTSIDMEWAKRRRDELQQTYCEALIGLAKAKERAGDGRAALGYYLRASMASPQREDLAGSAMRIYHDMGLVQDALTIYARLERELKNQLDVAPAPQLREFAEKIRAGVDGRATN